MGSAATCKVEPQAQSKTTKKGEISMRHIKHENPGEFRIESNRTLRSPHWDVSAAHAWLVHERSLAVAMAAKTRTVPSGGEVRVVYTPTGEVIFRKGGDGACARRS